MERLIYVLRMASFDFFEKALLITFIIFLGVGIVYVDPRVVVETWSVLVAGIAAHFYCVVRGLRLYIFLPR